MSASYVHWLKPSAPWTIVGSNEPLGTGFADIVWADNTGSIVIDELKSASLMRWALDLPTRRQIRSYVTDANTRWGNRFRGVRVIKLSAPALSLMVDPDLVYRPLSSTNLYFPFAGQAAHMPPSKFLDAPEVPNQARSRL